MCCRCPPSVGLYSYIYILLTVVVTFYFQHAKSIYLKDTRYLNLDAIQDYDVFTDPDFNFGSEIPRENGIFQRIRGTELAVSNTVGATNKTYINNKSFCEIMDNYIYYHIGESAQKPVSLCLVRAGFHRIYDNHPGFNDVAMPPLEMPTRKTFRLELIRHGEKIACKQFQFINGGQDNGLLEENDI